MAFALRQLLHERLQIAGESSVDSGERTQAASLGDGVSELRFTFGPGYRVYYTVRGNVVVILLWGGDKGSQRRDVERAKAMAKEL